MTKGTIMGRGDIYKVLIADYEMANINAFEDILGSNYTILAAKDGKSALKIAINEKPDIILLDTTMPEISGLEALSLLKSSDITRYIPVIITSDICSVEEEEKSLRLGAVDYITRPFNDTIAGLRVEMHLRVLAQIRNIERLGLIDSLTQIPNRRSCEYQIIMEWKRALRQRKPLGVLMIDVDEFRRFNDRYGYAHGDKALTAVAGVLTRTLKRSSDFFARWGGEEFISLIPDTDLDGLTQIGEQLRENVEKTVISDDEGRETHITISIGIHHEHPSPHSSVEHFLFEADKALYAAKAEGGNVVVSCIDRMNIEHV